MDRLLTYTEAAAVAGVSASRIAQIVKAEIIPAERFGPNVRVRESAVKAWVESRRIPDALPTEETVTA